MTDYFSLFFSIILIMTGRRHPENGTVQTAIVDRRSSEWVIIAHAQGPLTWINWKPRIQNGKQPDVASLNYYTHYFFYYTHYFSWLTRMAVAVYTSYALQIYEKRICVLREHQVSFHSSPKQPNCSVFAPLLQLYHYYSNYFSDY